MGEIMKNTDNVCLHLFDAYKVVDKNGTAHPLDGRIEVPMEGTHYGHCCFCGEWVDLTHARVATKEEMEKWRGK